MLNVAQFIAVWNVWCFSKLIICISSTVAKVHAVNSAPSNVYLIQQRSSNVSVLIGIYNYCLCRVRPRVASVSQFYNSLYLTLPTNSYLPTYLRLHSDISSMMSGVWCWPPLDVVNICQTVAVLCYRNNGSHLGICKHIICSRAAVKSEYNKK